MDYHLPRVMLWISNRSVSFFPTWDYAQLVFGPWAEYAMGHLVLLSGTDRLVNLAEWTSLVGIVVGASLIARELGTAARGQVIAAVAAGTIPTAVLEASGGMNGVVVAFWITLGVYFALKFARDTGWLSLVGSACACGLAVLTKGSALAILPPMLLICAVLLVLTHRGSFQRGWWCLA
jgi:4-amino-4-deoxy-L-arabinose transferase-like glycosyltransferase